MTFDSVQAWWWPYLFILIAGWLTTDGFRYLGVYFGGKASERGDLMVLVRTVATAFVAAVIGNLIVFPAGDLAATPLTLRLGAAACGFGAFLLFRYSVFAGIATAEVVLAAGLLLLP